MRISSSFTSVAILSATAVALLSACSPNPTNATANTRSASVSKGTLLATVSATGNIQPEDEVKLTFQSLGTVALLKANVGDSVQKGTVIAALDTADLDMALKKARSALKDSESALVIARSNYSRTIEGARPAEIAAAAASLSAANANYNKVNAGPEAADHAALEAKLRNVEAALRRAQSVYDAAYREDPAGIGGHPAGLELEQATNNFNAAKAEYDRIFKPASAADKSAALRQIADARAQLDKLKQPARSYDIEKAKAEVTQAENRIAQMQLDVEQAQRKLAQAALIAPFDGVVSAVDFKVGEANTAQSSVTMVRVNNLRIEINVDEVDVSKVKLSQEAIIKLDSLPGVELKGKIDRISPTSKIVNGVVSYAVRVALPTNANGLRPGMTANTRVVLEERPGVLLAPNWAIRKDKKASKSYLTVPAADNKTTDLEVVTGLKDDTFTEIISGAAEGQAIVAPEGSQP